MMRTRCSHFANTIGLVLPSAHRSPQPKRQIDRFGRFCTAHSRKSLYFTMGRLFPRKLPLPMGDLDPHLIHGSLDPPESVLNPNGISIGSAVIAGLTSVTDRPTDRPRYSVGNNRPHLPSKYVVRAMRPCQLSVIAGASRQ